MALVVNLDKANVKELVPDYNRRSYGISIVSFQRPANTTAYAARDVISSTTGSDPRALLFPNCGKENSGSGSIIKAHITVDVNLAANFDLGLYLFESEPTNHDDNSLLVLADGDAPFGYLSLTDALRKITNAATDPAGQLLYRSTIDLDQPFVCGSGTRDLFGLLVTETAFTPVSGMKFKILLGLERD